MDTDEMLIPPSAVQIGKVTTYHSLFEPDLACSDAADKCIHLIGERFGYNSEKQFNNPLLLKRHCQQGRWQALNNDRVFNSSLGGMKPKLNACRFPLFGIKRSMHAKADYFGREKTAGK